MDRKRFLISCIVALLLVVGLAACERSLSPSGVPAQTQTGGGAETTQSDDVMQQIWLLATQTAQAEQAQTGVVTTVTQVPPAAGGATETSVPSIEQPTEAAPAAPTQTQAPTPQPTAIVVPTATPGIPSTYVLQSGEFPFCIARRFNVNQYELLNASGLSLNSRPGAGYKLTIPQTGHSFEGNRTLRAHPTTHTVAAGETIYSIACLYGDVDPNAIAYANNLTAPYTLSAGQTLQIP